MKTGSFMNSLSDVERSASSNPSSPGLLPILNGEQIKRITRICGSSIPPELLHELTQAGDDREKVHEIGIRHTVAQAQDLLAHGVAGIHFYVLNQYFHIAEIMEQIQPALQPSTVKKNYETT